MKTKSFAELKLEEGNNESNNHSDVEMIEILDEVSHYFATCKILNDYDGILDKYQVEENRQQLALLEKILIDKLGFIRKYRDDLNTKIKC